MDHSYHTIVVNTSRFHSIPSYYHSHDTIVLFSPPEIYSNWEKLFLPFDFPFWICLVFTLIFAILIIVIIKFYYSVRTFVIGIHVQNPTYNFFGSFFGITQRRLPRENSARILLISFVMFCLVVRTAYQGEESVNHWCSEGDHLQQFWVAKIQGQNTFNFYHCLPL